MTDSAVKCQSLFDDCSGDVGNRCEKLTKESPNCECEQGSVSPYSPGTVQHNELLARLIFSPIHIDEVDGSVKEAAFSDVQDKGLSVNRLTSSNAEEIDKIGEEKAKQDKLSESKRDREYLGVVMASAGEIRAIKNPGSDGRAFCIYDTALKNNISHADVCQLLVGNKAKRKEARRTLHKTFSRYPKKLAGS
jgi:hypothetical protein